MAEQKTEIVMWWCEDDICDCTQPQINRWTRQSVGSWKCETLWEGTFRSEADATERAEQELELSNARLLFTHAGGGTGPSNPATGRLHQ